MAKHEYSLTVDVNYDFCSPTGMPKTRPGQVWSESVYACIHCHDTQFESDARAKLDEECEELDG